MAVTVDAVTTAPADTSTNTITISHTIGSGANRLLVVLPTWISSVVDRVVTGVTYNGVSCTQHTGAAQLVINSDFTYNGCDIWYMKEADLPSTGAYDVVITTTNFVRQTAGIISFAGADQTTPLGTSGVNNAGASNTTITAGACSNTANDIVTAVATVSGNATAATVSSSNTQRWETDFTVFGEGVSLGSTAAGTGSNITPTWTQGSGTNSGWVASAATVKAVAASGIVGPLLDGHLINGGPLLGRLVR